MHSPAFGEALRRGRLASGLTQEELAERASLSVRAISDLERGVKLVPRPSTLRLLVKGLDLTGAEAARLYQAAHLSAPGEAHRLPKTDHNLPAPLSSFVGREPSIAELQQLLQTVRLLTLTGAGGVGKTRLALEVAGRVRHEYADGVWLIELATVTDPALVPDTAMLTLGVKPGPVDTGSKRLSRRSNRQTLLILDNCEHLLAACAAFRRDATRARARRCGTGDQPRSARSRG